MLEDLYQMLKDHDGVFACGIEKQGYTSDQKGCGVNQLTKGWQGGRLELIPTKIVTTFDLD